MAEVDAEYRSTRNIFGKTVQTLKFNDDYRNASRNFYINEDEALDYLQRLFRFRNGEHYRINYLTSLGWRTGLTFLKNNNTNLAHHVFTHEMDIIKYQAQGLQYGDIHIFGIEVVQAKENEPLDWQQLFGPMDDE